MALVGVDATAFYAMIPGLIIGGFVCGMLFFRWQFTDRASREMHGAIKDHAQLLLEASDDQVGRLRRPERGEGGLWHLPFKEYAPEAGSTLRFYGTTLGIANMELAATLRPEFVSFANAILEKHKGEDPVQVSKLVWQLLDKVALYESQVDYLEDVYKRIKDGLSTPADEAQKLGLEDVKGQATAVHQLQMMLDEDLPRLKKELVTLKSAAMVTEEDHDPHIFFDMKKRKVLYRRMLDLTHIAALVPTGASALNMFLYGESMKRGAEHEKNKGPEDKLFSGLKIMVACIGVGVLIYLVLTALHI